MNSKAYEQAVTEHSAAFRVFDAIRDKYRNMEIDDAEFLAAKDNYDAATAKFDVAFSLEQNR